ncbi:transglutaminase-like domain-containing protein [Stratiformator vulcanicus]|uniref:Transglutaminase-like superfamily protein n=1 Tax=Stratiformator vulcanicus TaxID=2527980 RepID=A0A517QVP0_9PLAN|nr:transglutaminase domain-containing protein [Stratiformator vulcanicus]QDT35683.1 Transglutaminase-like superfamily protein [Stratiformator vulcanicus]
MSYFKTNWRVAILPLIVAIGCSDSPAEQIVIVPNRKTEPSSQPPTNPGGRLTEAGDTVFGDPFAEKWDLIRIGDARVGYARTQRRVQEGRVSIDQETRMTIRRFGKDLQIITRLKTEEEEKSGRLLAFSHVLENPPAAPVRRAGRIVGDNVELEVTIDGKTKEKVLGWEYGLKSIDWPERLFLRDKPIAGETMKFRAYLPEMEESADYTMRAMEPKRVKMFDGSLIELTPVTISSSLMPQSPMTAYVDDRGVIRATEQRAAGQTIRTDRVTAGVALEEISGKELDFALKTLIDVTPLVRAHRREEIVYRVTIADRDPTELLPITDFQQVEPDEEAGSALVTVTAVEIPDTRRPVRGSPGEEYIKPSAMIQSRDPYVGQLVRQAVGSETDPGRVAVAMEKYVARKMDSTDLSTGMASASEIARSMKGDCTEHAVLLAAMLRARKIPSRVAIGLVYIQRRSQMGWHMWTEAYLGGKWVPLDATLGSGGIGPAHLKLADASFADDGPAPLSAMLPVMDFIGEASVEIVEVK